MNTMLTNIDDVRAEIMRLENEKVFDQRAWAQVLGQLSNSPSRRQDAVRRMMTAKGNATAIIEQPQWMVGVAVETGHNADGSIKAYWVQVLDDEWGMWIHAESVGKAKSIYHQQDPSLEPADFTDLRALRPGRGAHLLDCTPFTDNMLREAGFMTQYDYTAEFPDAFLDFCPCFMCKAERLKPSYRVGITREVEA